MNDRPQGERCGAAGARTPSLMLASFRVLSRLRRCPSGPRSRTDCGLMLFCLAQASTNRLIFVFPFARISTTPCGTRSVSVNLGGLYHHFESWYRAVLGSQFDRNHSVLTLVAGRGLHDVGLPIFSFHRSSTRCLRGVFVCRWRASPIFSSYCRNSHLSAISSALDGKKHNGRSCGGEL